MGIADVPLPPGTETWAERYGPIGAVALMAVLALIVGLRQVLRERREDRGAFKKEQEDHDKRVADLYEKMVSVARDSHEKTLQLLAEQAKEHEQRYQALLGRHMDETKEYSEQLRAQSSAIVETLQSMRRKAARGGG